MSFAVSINLLLFGLTAPFAAALMDRFGIRQVSPPHCLVALGAGLTRLHDRVWQLLSALGRADRPRHGLDGAGLRGHHRQPLVRPATRAGDGRADRRLGDRPAHLPAAGGLAGRDARLAAGLAGGRRRPRWPSCRWSCSSCAITRGSRRAALRRRRRPTSPPPRSPAAPARRAVEACAFAARHRSFWALAGAFAICGATTNGLIGIHFIPSAHDHGMSETTAAGLLAAWASSTSPARSPRAGSPTSSTRACCWPVYYVFRGVGLLLLPLAARRDGPPEHGAVRRGLRPGLGRHGPADGGPVPRGLR